MPVPIFASEPLPVTMPAKVLEPPLLPTESATPAGLLAALLSVKVPAAPCNPPKVALVSVPKPSVPVPLVSKVLIDSAAELATTSEPPLTRVVPV